MSWTRCYLSAHVNIELLILKLRLLDLKKIIRQCLWLYILTDLKALESFMGANSKLSWTDKIMGVTKEPFLLKDKVDKDELII